MDSLKEGSNVKEKLSFTSCPGKIMPSVNIHLLFYKQLHAHCM